MEGRLHQVPASGTPLNLRLSFIPSLYGRALVARFLDPPPGNAEETDPLETADGGRTEGLWLVAGPTGSGKTTTLHTRLRARVRAGEKVLSVEDPVEALLPGVHQVSVGSPPGMGFALALRAFLRQSPDCILVGEIRDGETAGVALQAARTGHRILSTLHARNNAGVLRRFADLGQSPDALLGLRPVVLHQRLLPRLCSRCQRTEPLPGNWRRGLEALGLEAPDRIPARGGCPLCREGIAGRLPIRSSGIFAPERDSDRELLLAGWEAVLAGQITPGALAPLLPGVLRRRFALSGP
jgi:type II secretory ATPase GspE/PulE/Tfp pilus assembly ATPase PilB-like protein